MFDKRVHPNTKTMLDAWCRMTASPSEVATGPQASHFPEMLARLFVLQQIGGCWEFRSCGEDLPELLGRDLSEHSFTDLWSGTDTDMVVAALDAILDGNVPGLIRARGETMTGQRISLEIPLAPIVTKNGRGGRILGLYQTLGGEPMLGGRPVWRHSLTALFPPNASAGANHLRLVANRD